ncbi:MAG: hypothetical protein GY847_02925 [Proteobacteria bacterium]|nr:hypothetical protein [Pseudomonadota bacterium]
MMREMIPVVLLGILAAGCVENDISFFIEHVKMQPEMPKCEVTESDGFVAQGTLDLSFRNAYGAWYLLSNHLMAREDYGNLKAETNGIIIDGMEVHVRGLDGELHGKTEYYEFEHFIPPEATGVWAGYAIPATVVRELANEHGCLPLNSGNYPSNTIGRDVNGGSVKYIGMVYSVVRFLGHTNGHSDVTTPKFTFPIHLCCGCLVEWENCVDPCSQYCTDVEEHTMCTPGVFNGGEGYDCRALYHNPDAVWQGGCTEELDDGGVRDRLCSCVDDCSSN